MSKRFLILGIVIVSLSSVAAFFALAELIKFGPILAGEIAAQAHNAYIKDAK